MIKKNTILLLFQLFLMIPCAFNQYGIVFTHQGIPYKNQKEHFLYFLEHINHDDYPIQDKLGKISFGKEKKIEKQGDGVLYIEDSIKSVFKIISIEKKRNNYQSVKNKLVRRTIYLIDIECVSDKKEQCPQYIRLLSVDTSYTKKRSKIKVGRTYKMTIHSFFSYDFLCKKDQEGNFIYTVRAPKTFSESFLYENIWVAYIDFISYNWFETPNLKGLYYFP